MADRIFLARSDGAQTETEHTPFATEAELQTLIAERPELLCGDQLDPAAPRQWLLIRAEMPLPQGSTSSGMWWVDALFVDQDAIPTLVEVKRGDNTALRRTIVGQIFDYAAHADGRSGEEYREQIVKRLGSTIAANQAVAELLQIDHQLSIEEENAFWDRVEANIIANRLRLLFVSDEFPEALIRVVALLNEAMPEIGVAAIEVKQYISGNSRMYIPRVLMKLSDIQKPRPVPTPASRSSPAGDAGADTRFVTADPVRSAPVRPPVSRVQHQPQVAGERFAPSNSALTSWLKTIRQACPKEDGTGKPYWANAIPGAGASPGSDKLEVPALQELKGAGGKIRVRALSTKLYSEWIGTAQITADGRSFEVRVDGIGNVRQLAEATTGKRCHRPAPAPPTPEPRPRISASETAVERIASPAVSKPASLPPPVTKRITGWIERRRHRD